MEDLIQLKPIVDSVLLIGIAVFALAIWLFDKLTSFSLWKEIVDEQNTALAIILAGITIGLSIIIAMAHS